MLDIHALRHDFDDKIRRGIFQPVARHLPHHAAEDRLQDAVGETWELALRSAEGDKVIDDALLVHFCRQRAVDLSRHLARDGFIRRGLAGEALILTMVPARAGRGSAYPDYGHETEHRGH